MPAARKVARKAVAMSMGDSLASTPVGDRQGGGAAKHARLEHAATAGVSPAGSWAYMQLVVGEKLVRWLPRHNGGFTKTGLARLGIWADAF
jgi:hypothetical protein